MDKTKVEIEIEEKFEALKRLLVLQHLTETDLDNVCRSIISKLQKSREAISRLLDVKLGKEIDKAGDSSLEAK